jgi:hypothetical protein
MPRQPEAGLRRTLARALDLAPDRVTLAGYAHAPWIAQRQRAIAAAFLPGFKARAAGHEARAAGHDRPRSAAKFSPRRGMCRSASTVSRAPAPATQWPRQPSPDRYGARFRAMSPIRQP